MHTQAKEPSPREQDMPLVIAKNMDLVIIPFSLPIIASHIKADLGWGDPTLILPYLQMCPV